MRGLRFRSRKRYHAPRRRPRKKSPRGDFFFEGRPKKSAATAPAGAGPPGPGYNGGMGRTPPAGAAPRAALSAALCAALCAALAAGPAPAREELLVVQGVSDDGRSLVVRRGRTDGVVEGMEALFSTDRTSIAARVVEIARGTSLWTMSEPRGSLPFAAEDVVLFSNDLGSLHGKVPVAGGAAAPDDLAALLGGAADGGGDVIEEEARLDLLERSRLNRRRGAVGTGRPRLILRAGGGPALREAVTGVSLASETERSGLQFEGLYSHPWQPGVDVALGVRLDRDLVTQTHPHLDIPVSRLLVAAEATVRLNALNAILEDVPEGLYLGVGAGYGRSRSEVAGLRGEGSALVFPIAKAGYEMPLGGGDGGRRWALLMEGSAEYVSAAEELAGGLGVQETGILNAKYALGLSLGF